MFFCTGGRSFVQVNCVAPDDTAQRIFYTEQEAFLVGTKMKIALSKNIYDIYNYNPTCRRF